MFFYKERRFFYERARGEGSRGGRGEKGEVGWGKGKMGRRRGKGKMGGRIREGVTGLTIVEKTFF